MNLGLLLKTNDSLQEMGDNWTPELIDNRNSLINKLEEILGSKVKKIESNKEIKYRIIYESSDSFLELEFEDEKEINCISLRCILNENGMNKLNKLNSVLHTKYYDSEMADFIEI